MTGNITYIGNGRFRLRVSVGTGPEQKSYSKYVRADKDKIDLERIKEKKFPTSVVKEMAKFITEIDNGQAITPDRITFREFAEKWTKEYAERQLAPKTVFRYKELLERVNEGIGHIKLQKLGPGHLNSFYANLEETGIRKPRKTVRIIDGKRVATMKEDSRPLSKTTVNHHHRLISSILGKAVQWGYLINNPAERADPPSPENKNHAYLDEVQMIAVVDALMKESVKYQAMILLDMFSGMRRGELMGLKWGNIDLEKGVIKIDKASQYIPKEGTGEKDPKNKSSKRDISIPLFICNVLSMHKAEQQTYKEKKKKKKRNKLIEDNDYVFIQRNGKPMHPDTPSKWFPKFLKANGLEHVNFHGLRHTNASLMMDMGIDVATAASLLGHARKSTFLNIYAHMFKSKGEAVANAVQEKYGPTIQDKFQDKHYEKRQMNISNTENTENKEVSKHAGLRVFKN
jgi:integrase